VLTLPEPTNLTRKKIARHCPSQTALQHILTNQRSNIISCHVMVGTNKDNSAKPILPQCENPLHASLLAPITTQPINTSNRLIRKNPHPTKSGNGPDDYHSRKANHHSQRAIRSTSGKTLVGQQQQRYAGHFDPTDEMEPLPLFLASTEAGTWYSSCCRT